MDKALETFSRAVKRVEFAREYRRRWDDALQEAAERLVEEGGSRSFPFVWKDAMLARLVGLIK